MLLYFLSGTVHRLSVVEMALVGRFCVIWMSLGWFLIMLHEVICNHLHMATIRWYFEQQLTDVGIIDKDESCSETQCLKIRRSCCNMVGHTSVSHP